jgi:hypothetical protein
MNTLNIKFEQDSQSQWYICVGGERRAGPYPTREALKAAIRDDRDGLIHQWLVSLDYDPDAPLPEGTIITPRQPVPETSHHQSRIQLGAEEEEN